MNQYSPNNHRLLELNKKKILISKEINRLCDELNEKKEMLMSVMETHIEIYDKEINDLKLKCNHINDNGELAIDKEKKDKLLWQSDGSLKRISYCLICNSNFDNGVTHIPKYDKPNVFDIEDEYYDMDDNGGAMIINFNPNWDYLLE